jgi:hypothetical protein
MFAGNPLWANATQREHVTLIVSLVILVCVLTYRHLSR